MKIAISGASGLVGSTLKGDLLKKGHVLATISRHRLGRDSSHIQYDLHKKTVDLAALEAQDVIIHLAGANISGQSWTPAYKKEILDSRVESTFVLVNAIKKLNRRPKLFICASAVGYYGNHDPSVIVNEHSQNGHGFLADVTREWENASADLINLGVRVVHLRFGVILSRQGGALAKMLPAFYLGLGGVLGSGQQKMSWVALNEIPSIVDFIINHDNISGPINAVSPQAVTNQEFTKTLGAVIHRPTVLPVPDFMIKMLFGQMGQELLLEGVHVKPEVLLNAGYSFKYPNLTEALQVA
jgi:uncharacterized protein (TIGR01777 family)